MNNKIVKSYSLIRAVCVDARPTMPAWIGRTFLDVLGARGALEALRTGTLEAAVGVGRAGAAISTGRRRAQILFITVWS
jgi:hypothetical protein